MRKTIILMSGVAAIALMQSCASIVSKTSYAVPINSSPQSMITVTDKRGNQVYEGKTPLTVSLKSGAGFFAGATYQVKFKADGYDEQIVTINHKINGWYFGNLLIGGWLGMLVIDPATGAMYKLDSTPINIALNKTVAATDPQQIQIICMADVPESMKDKLVKIK